MKNSNAQNSLKCKINIEKNFTLRWTNFRGGEGGGLPVGPKDQLFPFFNFEGSPKAFIDQRFGFLAHPGAPPPPPRKLVHLKVKKNFDVYFAF